MIAGVISRVAGKDSAILAQIPSDVMNKVVLAVVHRG